MKPIHIIAALAASAGAAYADRPVLSVYTYDSFTADWGPGPQIEAAFETTCDCDLQLIGAGDGAALLSRIRLEGTRSDADIVLGLDTNLTAAAMQTGLFAPHGVATDALTLPVDWADAIFLPFDWGYFAFVHRTDLADVPQNFRDLAQSDTPIIIQDPRSSTPGLGLLMWVEAAYGDGAAEIWRGLADNIVTITPGWSESYGLFLQGEADMVLSYTTSPAYHLIAEDDAGFNAAAFDEGHYMQVELAAMLSHTDQPQLAQEFLAFLLEDTAQNILPTTNWMYPAALPATGLPDGFDTLTQPETALLFSRDEAAARRAGALDIWQSELSR